MIIIIIVIIMLSEKGLGNEIGIFNFFPDSDARWRHELNHPVPNEVICGHLCSYFLYSMRKCNKDFNTVLDEIYKSRVTE